MLILAYPWLLLVLPAPLLVWWWVPPFQAPTLGLRVPFMERLARASGLQPAANQLASRRGTWSTICLVVSWIGIVLSLARPQWLEPPVTRTVPVRDLLIAVDLSSSMQTKDFLDAQGTAVDRLTAVKDVLNSFLTNRQGDRVGLIVFGSSPFVQAPFTQDLDMCRELLGEMRVGMAGPKTALGDAIGLAVTVFDRTKVPERVLIALTDGNDTASLVPPQKAAEIARDKGITIYTVAVGDPRAAGEEKLDEVTLKRVAETTGGAYSHAESRDELAAIYRRLDALPTQPAHTLSHRPRRDVFYVPLAIALLVGLMESAVTVCPRPTVRQSIPLETAA